jgi:hypothetical protein
MSSKAMSNEQGTKAMNNDQRTMNNGKMCLTRYGIFLPLFIIHFSAHTAQAKAFAPLLGMKDFIGATPCCP